MPPASVMGDMHACPMQTPMPPPAAPIPHGVGPIIKGASTVMICKKPAVRVGDPAQCVTPAGPAPIDTVMAGCFTVMIEKMPAARVGDACTHGGSITGPGAPTVMIG